MDAFPGAGAQVSGSTIEGASLDAQFSRYSLSSPGMAFPPGFEHAEAASAAERAAARANPGAAERIGASVVIFPFRDLFSRASV